MTFESLFTTNISFDAASTLVCFGAALLLGLVLAAAYMLSGPFTKSFAVSLVLVPAVVQVVILFVNQNFGAALAVGGTFALMRFRSAPGTAREIAALFCTMAIGITTGMGYIVYAIIVTAVLGFVMVLLGLTPFGEDAGLDRSLKILIPESLANTDVFDDVFRKYTRKHHLELIRTTNMGAMYELRYYITLKNRKNEKEFVDALRERNGNMPIICAQIMPKKDEL